MARVIAIGDVHGCDVALETLLDVIDPEPDDLIITLGDLVDRGPATARCLDLVLELRERCHHIGILGNHEEMMLSVVVDGQPPSRWLQFGGIATLDSYGFSGDIGVVPQAHIDLMEDFFAWFETDTHFFAHANYDPQLALDQQTPELLRWKSLEEYLPGPHRNGKIAVVGHTADRTGEVFSLKHLSCIDTFCYGGKWLTALDTTTGTIWQTNQIGEVRE
jgi:serine/threonine protein phosphatase 1